MDTASTIAVLGLTTLLALVVAGVAARERFVRFFFELEDPRPIAATRVAFGVVALVHIHGLGPHAELLFAPQGMFAPGEAHDLFGASDRLVPRFSLLYFDGIPFRAVLDVAQVAAVLLALGLFSRTSALATLVLQGTLEARNPVFLEGTDVVLRVGLVYLVGSRCGATWSIRRNPGTRSVELWVTRVPIPTPAQHRADVRIDPPPPELRSTTRCADKR